MKAWETHFDERQRKEIAFCLMYEELFSHGTDGHNIRLIVAKMAKLLETGAVPYIAPEVNPVDRPVQPNKPAVLKD